MSSARRWRLEPVLRGVVSLGLFSLVLVPLVITSSLVFPATSGKGFVVRIAIEVAFAAWLVMAIGSSSARPRFSPVLGTFALWLAVAAVANAGGVDPSRSFWGTPERMLGFVGLLHLFALLVVAGSCLRTPRGWRRLYGSSVAISTLLSVVALAEFAFFNAVGDTSHRSAATLGNPALLATFLLLNLFLAGYLLAVHRGPRYVSLLLGGAIAIQTVAIAASGTRAAAFGALTGAGVALALIAVTRLSRRMRLVALAASAVITALLVVGAASQWRSRVEVSAGSTPGGEPGIAAEVVDPAGQRPGQVVTAEPASLRQLRRLAGEGAGLGNGLNTRLVAWSVAARAIAERPLRGWGQENFEIAAERYWDPRLEYGKVFDRPHNSVLEWAVNAGIPGAVAYVGVFLAAMVMVVDFGRRSSPAGASVLAGLFVAYAVNSLFLFDTVTSSLLVTLVLAQLHAAWTSTRWSGGGKGARRTANVLAIPLIAAAVFGVAAINLPAVRALQMWRAADPMGEMSWDDKAERIEQAIALDTFADEGLRRAYLELASAAFARSLEPGQRDRLIDRAAASMQALVDRDPGRTRPLEDRGRFLVAAGRAEEGLADLRLALDRTPNKPFTLVQLAAALERTDRSDEAFRIAQRAYELEPRHEWPRLMYSGLAHAHGETELAVSVLRPLEGDRQPGATVSGLLPDVLNEPLTAGDRRWLGAVLDFNARTVGYTATSWRLVELGRLVPGLEHVGAMSRVAIVVESDAAALRHGRQVSGAP